MDHKSRAQQCLLEHQIIGHVKAALRLTLGWDTTAVGAARKLSSVQFTMQSLFRHLERLMKIEEEDGYLSPVAERKPNLANKATALSRDHQVFRDEMRRIAPIAIHLAATDLAGMNEVCKQLHALLHRLDVHDQTEVELLRTAFWDDEGGEA
jgi:hypothetical protein